MLRFNSVYACTCVQVSWHPDSPVAPATPPEGGIRVRDLRRPQCEYNPARGCEKCIVSTSYEEGPSGLMRRGSLWHTQLAERSDLVRPSVNACVL